ncbi:hypothetical protein BC834DRAFT_587223 [Gloeopeniophorella convolvens]|nr:hypothetical protein BC834DRAFT_587223 [Gloeopeniophorella convolvens]
MSAPPADRILRDYLVLVKLLHVVAGLELWYFVSNAYFDWELLRGKRPLKWPGWIYLATRASSLGCSISVLIGFNARNIDCKVWAKFAFLFPILQLELSLLLTALRVTAISETYRPLMAIAAVAWIGHAVSFIHRAFYWLIALTGTYCPCSPRAGTGRTSFSKETVDTHDVLQLQGQTLPLSPTTSACAMSAPQMQLLIVSIVTLVTYFILISTTLYGLLRQRKASSFGVWRMLYNQGLTWFTLAVLAEIPTLVMLCFNFSPPFNMLFQVPRTVIVSIGTTTMFRTLQNYSRTEDTQYVNQIVVIPTLLHVCVQER